MLKRLGLPVMALGAVLGFGTSKPANAQVQFGVQVGPPYYSTCSVYDPYCNPYAYDYAPYPYVYGGYGWHHDGDRDRGYRGGYEFRDGHEFHGNERGGGFRGGNGFHGGGGSHGGRR